MKKNLLTILASGLLLFGITGNAMAYTIPYTETYDPGTNYLMSTELTGQHLSHSWTFDITDHEGWSTPNQVFNDGTIVLTLQDDGGQGDGPDKATFTFELGTGVTNSTIQSFTGVSFTVDASAFNDGLIWATLTATDGDFYFISAVLNVTSDVNAPIPAPEPSTVLLLGSGLLGLIYVGRKRVRK